MITFPEMEHIMDRGRPKDLHEAMMLLSANGWDATSYAKALIDNTPKPVAEPPKPKARTYEMFGVGSEGISD